MTVKVGVGTLGNDCHIQHSRDDISGNQSDWVHEIHRIKRKHPKNVVIGYLTLIHSEISLKTSQTLLIRLLMCLFLLKQNWTVPFQITSLRYPAISNHIGLMCHPDLEVSWYWSMIKYLPTI